MANDLEVRKYRRRGAVVEAVQLTPANLSQVWNWADSKPFYSPPVDPAGSLVVTGLRIYIPEGSGSKIAEFGDWIVRDSSGRFWARKSGEFAGLYETYDERDQIEKMLEAAHALNQKLINAKVEAEHQCRKWIDAYRQCIGVGEYGHAARIILTLMDGTVWCEVYRCPGHSAGTEGRPCMPGLRERSVS